MRNEDTKTNLSGEVVKRDEDNVTLRKDFIRCWVHANPSVDRSKASRLYDALCDKFPGMTRGGHRGMVGRLNPWETVKHECPNCAKQAEGMQEIKEDFGLRLVKYHTKSEGEKSKLYFQSHCRQCRKKSKEGGNGGQRVNPEVEKYFTNESDAAQ